eukprot:gene21030-23083_t
MEAVYNYLARVKSKLKEVKEVHVFGDFNCNMLKSNALSSLVKDTCNIMGGAQLIKIPTRETATSSSLIENFICTAEHFIKDCGVIKTAISDHYMLYAIRKGKKIRCSPRIIETRSFKKFDENKFNEDLEAMDLTEMYNSENIDDAATILTEKFLGVADKHAPKETIRVKNRINNIFSDELLLLMKERDHAKVISARTGREEDWLKYKKLRNKVNNKKNQEKKSHFNELIQNSKDDPKQMWKNLKELVPNKITEQSQIKRLEINGNDETDSLKIAEHFNHYFVNIASKLADKFKRVTSTQATLPNQTTSVLHFQQVSSQKVYTFIKELKNGKSTGIDGISVKLLKAGAKSLSPALAFLFNYSIATSTVPKIWKRKRVSPIHKSGGKTDCCNYRPISIQPIPLKLLELVIHEQLRD